MGVHQTFESSHIKFLLLGPYKSLDPHLIQVSAWSGRCEAAVQTEDWLSWVVGRIRRAVKRA